MARMGVGLWAKCRCMASRFLLFGGVTSLTLIPRPGCPQGSADVIYGNGTDKANSGLETTMNRPVIRLVILA